MASLESVLFPAEAWCLVFLAERSYPLKTSLVMDSGSVVVSVPLVSVLLVEGSSQGWADADIRQQEVWGSPSSCLASSSVACVVVELAVAK